MVYGRFLSWYNYSSFLGVYFMVFLKQQTWHSMAPMARNWLAIETTTELEVPGGSTSRSFWKEVGLGYTLW